jgi:hypothetical protein
MMWYAPKERLRLLMDSAIGETDGGDREAVIRELNLMITASDDDGDNEELLEALGETDAERYEAACDLFRECVQSGSRPKRGA